jgi:RNA polymerase sigma-70 factor, ECF subfamily
MENQDINQLIELSLCDDRKAFRQIVESHQYMIYSLAFRVLGNEEDAKDIVQDSFLRIWLNLKNFDMNQKFSTWAYRIASNLCIDKLRKQKIKTTTFNHSSTANIESDDFEKHISDKELGEIILSLTEELSPKQKIVFTLRYLEEIEVEEIKKITGLSNEKIKSNLYVARQTIRKKIEKY